MSSTFIRSSVKTPRPALAVESLALFWVDSAAGMMPSPWNTLPMPSKMIRMPWPPASTTPAFFSTGSRLGVSSRARWPADRTRSHSSSTSAMPLARASSEAMRATVRMVPSVGFMTAL